MTKFEPFPAIRYHQTDDVSGLLAPPYDVLSAADRSALIDANQYNSVQIDFPPGKEDPSAYNATRRLLDSWLSDATLIRDAAPTYTVMRMTAPPNTDGTPGRTTTGVLGALTLEQPGKSILPHEQTTPKDKADRLNLIRATEINTSPIWGLSLAAGLGDVLASATSSTADAFGTDDEGVLHEAWVIVDPTTIENISSLVSSTPVVIADGHHRFETANTYLAERIDAEGVAGNAAAILTYIVELSPQELEVRAIHRQIRLPDGIDLASALATHFAVESVDGIDPATIVATMKTNGCLALQEGTRSYLLTPNSEKFEPNIELDSERVRAAISQAVEHAEVSYHHNVTHVLETAMTESNCAAILVRPATVEQIRRVADDHSRMPAKTTFFWPKPRTGWVFRSVR